MFNWLDATVEECAWHIAKTKSQYTTSVYKHHIRTGNTRMSRKIEEARELAKNFRKILEAEKAMYEIKAGNYSIIDNKLSGESCVKST